MAADDYSKAPMETVCRIFALSVHIDNNASIQYQFTQANVPSRSLAWLRFIIFVFIASNLLVKHYPTTPTPGGAPIPSTIIIPWHLHPLPSALRTTLLLIAR
jgi:hypothetical protein